MKKTNNYVNTQIKRVPKEQGESIEEMLRRLTANKEPIPTGAEPIYTPMAEGVIPDYDIRTDRQEVAIRAQDKYAASKAAKTMDEPTFAEKIETAQDNINNPVE